MLYEVCDTCFTLLLTILSRFSRVWLCATLWTSAFQAVPSVGFPRQEYWRGLPCPLQGVFLAQGSRLWVLYHWRHLGSPVLFLFLSLAAKSCPILETVDCSLPASSVHGFLQARILESVAIIFSRGSFQPRNQTKVSCIAGRFFTDWAMREALFYVVCL